MRSDKNFPRGDHHMPPDWDFLTLKEYFDTILDERINAYNKQIEATKEHFNVILNERNEKLNLLFEQMNRAVSKAEAATERRFEAVNEFRAQLADQARAFMPRLEYEASYVNVDQRINNLKEKIDRIESTKQGGNATWTYVFASASLIALIISIGAIIFHAVGAK
jgi:hypothetical protein